MAAPKVSPVDNLSTSIVRYARDHFDLDHKPSQTFDDYLKLLQDQASSAPADVAVDTSHPLSHYFVSSSHNTYLTGNQLWSRSSTDTYKHVLLRKCRCIEIDVWDGSEVDSSDDEADERGENSELEGLRKMFKRRLGRLHSVSRSNDENKSRADAEASFEDAKLSGAKHAFSHLTEPRVLHGHTATKEVPFREVCSIIGEFAFATTDMPLIVSLEVHCSPPQQEMMVDIMRTCWGDFLVNAPDDLSDTTPLPPLESLKRKILIKVKYTPPEKAALKKLENLSDVPADDASSSEDEPPAVAAVKKGAIIEKLSGLGVYTRAYHFHRLDQPEARIPTHIFAVSETKLLALCKSQPEALLRHNANYLMRVYPKGSRLLSSNLNPVPFWRYGVQLAALNWQIPNAAVMINEAQFEGTGGFMLKPVGYHSPDAEPLAARRSSISLILKILAGQNLGEGKDIPNVYVKCELHAESAELLQTRQTSRDSQREAGKWKLRTANVHARDPDFAARTMAFPDITDAIPDLTFIRIKVMDDVSYQKDRMLGWVCYRLDRMPQGLTLLHLRGIDATPTGGLLLVHIQVNGHADAGHDTPGAQTL